jgi:NitT/TauT family transport system substrate-binding protein
MTRVIAFILAVIVSTTAAGSAASNDVVRLGLNPTVLAYLPILIALDRGYFTAQHIEIQLKPNSGSSLLQLPLLARGDIDIAPMVLAPAFLNQLNEGFNVKLIAAGQSSHAGWNDNSWVVVRQDVWDSGAVRKLADLRGKVVDGSAPGGPPNMLLKSALAQAGMTLADVTYSERIRGGPEMVSALRNHAVDALAVFEPGASVMQVQHIAHKLFSVRDVIPWLQETFVAASGGFLKDHPEVAARFLVAYLQGVRDLGRSNGRWTPALLATLAAHTGIPVADLGQVPGPAYVDPSGAIDSISIDRQQSFYLSEHLIAKPLAFADMVDTRPLFAATRALAGPTPRK